MAERYQDQFERAKYRTYAQLADHFGVTRATVTSYMALLTKLPDDFVAWLRDSDDTDVIGSFCERRLRPVTRLGSDRAKVAALRRMMRGAEDAGVTGVRTVPASSRG